MAALVLVGGETQRIGGEAFRFLDFARQKVNLAALDEQKRQAAQASHRGGALDCSIDEGQAFIDSSAAGMCNAEIRCNGWAQERHLLARGETASKNGDGRFEFTLPQARAAQCETGVAYAVCLPGSVRDAQRL